MGFSDAIKSALSQYAGFSGRARRSEFWNFYLFYTVVLFATGIIGNLVGFGGLAGLALLGLTVPAIAANTRRLHDTGHSGWWQLLSIVAIFFYVQDSQGDNEHGPSPKTLGGSFVAPVGS